MDTIGNRIREARIKAGLTQPELARRCGWSGQSRISNYERCIREPRAADVKNLANVLGINEAWLWTGEGNLTPKSDNLTYEKATSSQMGTNLKEGICGTPASEDDVFLPCIGQDSTYITLRFSRSLLERADVAAANASFTFANDQDMAPVLPRGAIVAFDRSSVTVRDGDIYVIDDDGCLRICYLERLANKELRLTFENRQAHPTEECHQTAVDRIRVIGRVFWWSVLR